MKLFENVIQSLADEYCDGEVDEIMRGDFKLRDILGEDYTDIEIAEVIISHCEDDIRDIDTGEEDSY